MARRGQAFTGGPKPFGADRYPADPLGKRVGQERKHDSAPLHVTGAAHYIDDIVEPYGTLHVAAGHAPFAKGQVTTLDLTAVREASGVVAVLTATDIPYKNNCAPVMDDEPVLSGGDIQFHGQPLFAVVGETRDAALKAVRLAVIEGQETNPAVTVEAAQELDADLIPPYQFKRGDVDQMIQGSAQTLSGGLTIGGQEHFYLEGQVALAVPTEDGSIKLHSSSQHPGEVQHLVAAMLGLADAEVTVECRRMGGAFGGKETQAAQWAALAALAAYHTGRPVKMRLDRDDDMKMTGKRHDFKSKWSVGLDADGRLNAVQMTHVSRCGFSADLSLGVNDRAMFHSDNAYYYPSVEINSRRLKTNTVSNTAFRGFGGPQGLLCAEHMMECLAIHLGQDALDVRKVNFYGDETDGRNQTPFGMTVTDNIMPELVDALEKSSDYRTRRSAIQAYNASSQPLKKGLALTPVKFGISFTLKHLNQAGALVHVFSDGSVQLNHGGTEMGQGLYIKVAAVVAEEFGIDTSRVKITATTTDKVPNAAPTAASAGSDLNGMAARDAASQIRDRMTDVAARLFQSDRSNVRFADNRVFVGDESISFQDLASKCVLERVSLSSTGFYATPHITWDRETKTGRPFLYFAYGACCAEVTIDTLTGEMAVDRVDILHDVGHSLNPAIDIGQIEGGFVQGMGWLTTEELVWDHKGVLKTHAPSTYKIPTANDVPADFRVALYQTDFGNREDTIHKSKAVGEPPLMLASAVWCAVFDAVASVREGHIPTLTAPATPEAILKAVRHAQAATGR